MFASLVFLGMLLSQAAWMLAVPPYRAIDEFDHVYRSAGVATGQWRLTEEATNGRGLVVDVPADIVEGASAQCASLPYTGPDNCFPIRQLPGGRVAVATAAGDHHPAFYFVTGTVARPFEAAAADYAMRIVSAFISALGVGFAAYCLALCRAGPWTKFGLLGALTPVLIYTTIIPAPNSWEIVSGLCLWTTLLAAALLPPDERRVPRLLGAAVVAACVLATPRAIGPLWLGLIVVVTAVFLGWSQVASLIGRHRLAVAAGVVAVTTAVFGSTWWTVSAGWVGSGGEGTPGEVAPDADVAMNPTKWILELVGAFPYRDQPAPIPVYVLYLLVVGTMLWLGIRRGAARERTAIVAAVVLTLLVPITLTWMTAEQRGAIWQGRYGLAFVVGILPLCGMVLDRVSWAPVERARLLPLGLAMLAIAQVYSVFNVARDESVRPVSASDPSWVTLPPILIAVLMLLGFTLMALDPLRAALFRLGAQPPVGSGVARVDEVSDDHGRV